MKVSKKIIKKILNENAFSLKCALAANISQAAIREQAKRNSDKLALHSLVEFYKAEGFTDEEIFAQERQ